MTVGERILARRKALKLSRSTVVKRCSFTERTLQNYEEGKRSPGIHEIQEIAEALDTTVSALLGESGQSPTADDLLKGIEALYMAGNLSIEEIIERLGDWRRIRRERGLE